MYDGPSVFSPSGDGLYTPSGDPLFRDHLTQVAGAISAPTFTCRNVGWIWSPPPDTSEYRFNYLDMGGMIVVGAVSMTRKASSANLWASTYDGKSTRTYHGLTIGNTTEVERPVTGAFETPGFTVSGSVSLIETNEAEGAISAGAMTTSGVVVITDTTPVTVTGTIETSAFTVSGVSVTYALNECEGALSTGAQTISGSAWSYDPADYEQDATAALDTAGQTISGEATVTRVITGALSLGSQSVTGNVEKEMPVTGALSTAGQVVEAAASVLYIRRVTGAISAAAQTLLGAVKKALKITGAIETGGMTISANAKRKIITTGAISLGGAEVYSRVITDDKTLYQLYRVVEIIHVPGKPEKMVRIEATRKPVGK